MRNNLSHRGHVRVGGACGMDVSNDSAPKFFHQRHHVAFSRICENMRFSIFTVDSSTMPLAQKFMGGVTRHLYCRSRLGVNERGVGRYGLAESVEVQRRRIIVQRSSWNVAAGRATFSPGLNAGIPRYGHELQRNASPR